MYNSFLLVWGTPSAGRLPVRVIGRDFPTPAEPCTTGERTRAIIFYSDALRDARAALFQARLCGYGASDGGYAARCFATVRRLEKERAVWLAAAKYALPDGVANSPRAFNFAPCKGVN